MKKLEFSITIAATPKKVWTCLWGPENYKQWTRIFGEGSYYQTDSFTEGSSIHLLTPKGDGMYSVIDKLQQNHLLVFRHIGMLKNFQEQPIDEATKAWTNSLESYTITQNGDQVQLTAHVDMDEAYIKSMEKLFPPALEVVKQMAEN